MRQTCSTRYVFRLLTPSNAINHSVLFQRNACRNWPLARLQRRTVTRKTATSAISASFISMARICHWRNWMRVWRGCIASTRASTCACCARILASTSFGGWTPPASSTKTTRKLTALSGLVIYPRCSWRVTRIIARRTLTRSPAWASNWSAGWPARAPRIPARPAPPPSSARP